MNVPKVEFELASIKFETQMLYYFCFTNNHYNSYIFKKYPELKKNLSKTKTKRERLDTIKIFTKIFWKKNRNELEKQKKRFQIEWNKINDRCMSNISSILETEWPSKRKKIKALISMNPICPRFLNDWAFSVYGFEKDIRRVHETVAHEALHFLYFKKWKEVFPNSRERNFDTPYLEWRLSEILAPVILKNPKIKKLIRIKPMEYPEHKKIKIGKNSLTKHFELIYKKSLKKKEPFSEFLKKSYKEIKIYKNKIR